MSQSRNNPVYGSATKSALRNRIDEYSEVLYEDTFKCEDLDAGKQESQSIIQHLKSNNAIRSKEEIKDEVSGKYINVWEWTEQQAHLQEHWENRDELPCGCRSHIPGEQDGDTYYCKFCGDAHSRETIKECL